MYLYSIGKGFGLWHLKARKDMCLCIMLGNIRLAGAEKWYLEYKRIRELWRETFIGARFMNLQHGPLYTCEWKIDAQRLSFYCYSCSSGGNVHW
jgi:hypothetical protein